MPDTARRRPRGNLSLTLLLLALAGLLFAACGGGSDDDDGGEASATTAPTASDTTPKDPIKVRFLPATESMAVLPQLQALAKDYFTEEGVELEYLGVLANAAQAAQTVVSGQADIAGTGSTGALTTISANRDVVTVAMVSKEPTTLLTLTNKTVADLAKKGVTPKSPIKDRLAALKGLTLALPAPGSSTDIVIRTTLQDAGIDPDKDLTIQPVNDGPGLVAAAKQERVNGYAFSPPESVIGVAEGWGTVWVSYPAGDVPAFKGMPLTEIVTSKKFLAENPEAVRRVLKALWRASEDIKTDPEAVRTTVKERWFKDLDPKVYDASFDAVLPGFERGLEPEKSGFETLLKTFNTGRPAPVDLAFDDVYDTKLVEETKP